MAYLPIRRTHIEYHSPEWARMVETGWVTSTVEVLGNGTQVAAMLWQPKLTWN
jgi:hypothetical protein